MLSALTILTMRIESISAEADRAGRYCVKLSDGASLRLYRQTVEDFGLYTGMEMSEQQLQDLQESAGKMSARMRAVRILAASNVTKADLQQRLIQKGEDKQHAAEAVQWMADMALIDDAQTARQIAQRCIAKGYGLARAKQMLYEKRVPKSYWPAVLEDYPDQMQHVLHFLQSRLNKSWEAKDIKRATDALLRKGHSYSQIKRALEMLCDDLTEIPED